MELEDIRFDQDGMVPVIAQDRATGAVLMLAYATRQTLQNSLETGHMTYWSRSRDEVWEKGATSGHLQHLHELRLDCDGDAILAIVDQTGPACHTGKPTCWGVANGGILAELDQLMETRAPGDGYTGKLLADPHLAASKVEEEAGEVAAVVRGRPNEDSLDHEAADLLYHLVAALHAAGGGLEPALRALRKRRG